ncbi:MAG: hypothetical protein V4669_13735 [Pseudomonadota bacterium]
MTVPMKALKSFPYAGKRLKVGQVFEARGRIGAPGTDAHTLAAIGSAVAHTSAPVQPVVTRAMTAGRTRVEAPTYDTRMMTAAPVEPAAAPVPMIVKAEPAEPVEPARTADVSLDDMDAEALHALARARGVKVHHLAGAAKVRQALLDAQA